MKIREIIKEVTGVHTQDGAGVRLRRVISRPDVYDFDPFLMLDAFDSKNPDDYTRGFPWHPHRGIETVTYLIKGDIELAGNLGVGGIAPQVLGDLMDRFAHHTTVAVHRTRRPALAADLVEHGTANADAGVGFKTGALAAIKLAHRLKQADHAGLNEVVELHVGWQASLEVMCNPFHQPRVLLNDLLSLLRRIG